MAEQTIPVLDLTQFTGGGSGAQAFVRELGEALTDTGFFALTHHGVDSRLIHRTYELLEAFFTQPDEVKFRYEVPGLKGQRGFTSFGKEHAKDHSAPDLKEFWHVGRTLLDDHPLAATYARNVWPEELPEFKTALSELYQQLDDCSLWLLEATSLFLGEERNLVADMARDGNSVLRLIHYPPVPEDAPPAAMRAAPHEDINLITLLCEATAGGLELLGRDGVWRPIHALSGQIIVDAGDMLQNLTNGLVRSTTHRVSNPDNSRSRRFSIPFFVHPRSEVDLTPLPGCVARTGGQPTHPSITAGEYLMQRLREIGLA